MQYSVTRVHCIVVAILAIVMVPKKSVNDQFAITYRDNQLNSIRVFFNALLLDYDFIYNFLKFSVGTD